MNNGRIQGQNCIKCQCIIKRNRPQLWQILEETLRSTWDHGNDRPIQMLVSKRAFKHVKQECNTGWQSAPFTTLLFRMTDLAWGCLNIWWMHEPAAWSNVVAGLTFHRSIVRHTSNADICEKKQCMRKVELDAMLPRAFTLQIWKPFHKYLKRA